MVELGEEVENWQPPTRKFETLIGRHVRLDPLHPDHAAELFAANAEDDRIWDYLPYGPFPDPASYREWVAEVSAGSDPYFYAIRDLGSGLVGGVASYLRINPLAGSIEVGHINLAPRLQKTRAATEAMFLMMDWAFDAGYRRYEWKCNALNLGSRRAAQRYGFSFEGVHRQAGVVKGRNRDTAWFSILDREYPAIRAAFAEWLAPGNFDGQGRQRVSLGRLTEPLLASEDLGLGRV